MGQFQLRDYIAALRKYWWLVLLTTAIAAGAAYGITLTQTPMYQSQIRLQATPLQSGVDVSQAVNAYVGQITSIDFLRQVANDAQVEIPAESIRGAMNVQAKPNESTVYVSVDDKDGPTARLLADTIAADFVAQVAADVPPGGSPRIRVAQLERAPLPARPYKPSKTINTAAGAALGLVLGIVLAIGLALLDDTLKSNEDVERYLGLNTLGAIPKL